MFAPDYKKIAEVYQELLTILKPIVLASSKVDGVIRTTTGGRIDFWTLNDENAGRSRKYRRAGIDESAFTVPNMMDIWKRSIKPTLLDYSGRVITASNTNGVDTENFLWQVCNQPEHGFIEYHAPSMSNPLIPLREPGETDVGYAARRLKVFEDLRKAEHPLVWQQEYLADFVDWSGIAFFGLDKLLVTNPAAGTGKVIDGVTHYPLELPDKCDTVFAVVDSATKTGKDNDGTACTYFVYTSYLKQLIVADWELVQIEGASLEEWLPTVSVRLEELARRCGAREGSRGVFIEDKDSGQILLQQARKHRMPVTAIPSGLTAIGKDERALSVSSHVFTGRVKLGVEAYDKTTVFKKTSRNHLVSQVTGFRIGDPAAAKRADDLLDTFTYGVALTFGDSRGL